MRWWFDGLNLGNAIFMRKLQDNHHDEAGERESPFDESRRQGRLFWRGFQLQKSSERSGAMECPANCSPETLFCNSPKATFSPGNPLRCVLLRKRLCSRHQRLFPIEYHDTGRLHGLFDLQHEKWERKSLWRSTLGRMCPHQVAELQCCLTLCRVAWKVTEMRMSQCQAVRCSKWRAYRQCVGQGRYSTADDLGRCRELGCDNRGSAGRLWRKEHLHDKFKKLKTLNKCV